MGQITTGIRAILSHPAIYDRMQRLTGARYARTLVAQRYIRAKPGDVILDIGCGTGEILDYLPAGITYIGYDISAPYIESARKRYGACATFHCQWFDEFALDALPKFDIIMAIGLVHHLDDAHARQLLALAKKALKPGGRLITRDPCYAPGQSPIARLLIACDRGQHVRSAEQYDQLAQGIFPQVTGDLVHHRMQADAMIPHTHYTMELSA
jgi:SAM-dependent methyltransferase